jgi:hypothetical protein
MTIDGTTTSQHTQDKPISTCTLRFFEDPDKTNKKTCFTDKQLRKIVKAFGVPNTSNMSRDELEQALYNSVCTTSCNSKEFLNTLYSEAFKFYPISKVAYKPRRTIVNDSDHWLVDNSEIDLVLWQLSQVFPTFVAFKTWYCDFMTNLSIDDQDSYGAVYQLFNPCDCRANNIKSAGFIYNTDHHGRSGEHWIAVYIDCTKMTFEIYDSYGFTKTPEVYNDYYKLLKSKCPKLKRLFYSEQQQDFDTDECGVYALAFIFARLSGQSFESLSNTRLSNDFVRDLRKLFFRLV